MSAAAAPAPFQPPRPLVVPVVAVPARPVVAVTDGCDAALPAMRAAAMLAARLDAPVQAVAALAEGRRAELVVVAGGPPRPGDRTGRTEAALDVVRAGQVPVLAVGPQADGTLRRAVVAMDFGRASLRAAALACRLLAPGATLSLVHVKPRAEPGDPEWDAWDAARDRRVSELFQRLVVALRGAAGGAGGEGRRDVTIGTAILVGDQVEELVDYAARVGADLVAVGTHGGGFVERRFVGSVVRELVRRAGVELHECSVLVCPAPAADDRSRAERVLAFL